MAPPFCWTCQGNCVSEQDREHRIVAGRTRFFCSKECKWLDESNPGRYTGDRNYLDRYHGWEASKVIEDLGFVRSDGETLIGQPHLGAERRWTLSDIRARGLTLSSPNIRVAQELGLPNGDHSDIPTGNGSVPPELVETELVAQGYGGPEARRPRQSAGPDAPRR
jgi:YHS domain-containing protein